ERREIESHVTHTYRFLPQIPWTRTLKRVPDIAYGHHEKLTGKGYPRSLKESEIALPTRMMTISDIYDALTASDRPYKKAVPKEKAYEILEDEAKRGDIDSDLLRVFIEADIPARANAEEDDRASRAAVLRSFSHPSPGFPCAPADTLLTRRP